MVVSVALAAGTAFAADAAKESAATNAVRKVDFAEICAKGSLKGVTDRGAMSYAVDEDIEFTVSLEGVTNSIPKDAYRFKWKRSGDDGIVEEGFEPLESRKFSYKTRTSQPGFVRFSAELVDRESKPFTSLRFRGGAGVDADLITATNAVPKRFAQHFKDLSKRLLRTPFKAVERGEIPAIEGLAGAQAYSVSFPYAATNLVSGYLVVPVDAQKAVKAPARLCFLAYRSERPLAPPKANQIVPTCVTFFMGYPEVPKANRDEAYCDDLYLQMRRSIEFIKAQPEWNGADLENPPQDQPENAQ